MKKDRSQEHAPDLDNPKAGPATPPESDTPPVPPKEDLPAPPKSTRFDPSRFRLAQDPPIVKELPAEHPALAPADLVSHGQEADGLEAHVVEDLLRLGVRRTRFAEGDRSQLRIQCDTLRNSARMSGLSSGTSTWIFFGDSSGRLIT